jgi:tetratricopeptide (TPR) repeat protein
MYTDPEEREQQIKNISTVYSELADEVLPKLRRARVTLNYQIIGRSDDEIIAQYAADPNKLSLEEILYMTILTEDEAEKISIYNTAIELYPNDYRAYNNLGVIAFRKADYETAADYFAKAENVDAAAPEVMINLGYLELLKGNVDEAEAYIAKGAGSKAGDEALGNLYIAQGKYDAAAALLEGSKTNSTLLAHVLVENYVEARETLEAIKNPDAVTHYIKAVLGARTNNVVLLYDGLKEAISLEPELAQKAKVDLEFAKFANTETFLDILK